MKNASPGSPSLIIVSPGANFRVSSASAILDRSYSVSVERRGTSSRKDSYMRRRWKALSMRIRRKVTRSSAHRVDSFSVLTTVAARGALYINANSPKLPPGPMVLTFWPMPSGPGNT